MKMFPIAAAALVLAGWSFLAASADEPSGAPELTEGVDYVCVTRDGGAFFMPMEIFSIIARTNRFPPA